MYCLSFHGPAVFLSFFLFSPPLFWEISRYTTLHEPSIPRRAGNRQELREDVLHELSTCAKKYLWRDVLNNLGCEPEPERTRAPTTFHLNSQSSFLLLLTLPKAHLSLRFIALENSISFLYMVFNPPVTYININSPQNTNNN